MTASNKNITKHFITTKILIIAIAITTVLASLSYLIFSSQFSKNSSSTTTEIVAEKTEASPFGGHVHALAINGETNDIFLGARPVYRSVDGGLNWESIPIPKLEPRANITSITIDSKNPKIMYATGHGIAVAKSTDGGKTWETKNSGLVGISTEALAIDVQDSNKIYVWVLGDGIYRSKNAGESWGRVDDGPKNQEIRTLASVNLPTGMGGIWLYAGTDVGALKSPDCFCGWDKLPNEGLPTGKRVYSISADNNSHGTVYAGLRDGVYKTTDEGKTWKHLTNIPEDAVVAVHPKNSNIVYAVGSDGKLFTSDDAGKNWQLIK